MTLSLVGWDSVQAGEDSPRPAGETASKVHVAITRLFTEKCVRCHGDKQRKSDLDLSTATGIRKGGESGAVVVAGKPDKSLLYEMVHGRHMPPEGEGALNEAEIESVRVWIAGGALLPDSAASAVTQHDVVPLMSLRCTVCHGLRRREAGLDLRTKAGMLAGGKSGPAIVPGKPQESLVLKKIHAGEMPPRREVVAVSVKPMEPNEVALLEKWIAAGAPEIDAGDSASTTDGSLYVTEKDRQFWSFRPPQRPDVPAVVAVDRVANPIDAFLLAKLEAKGLTLSPPASKETLIRRAWFDLIGLPPPPEEIAAVLSDASPDWHGRMVDRLLASPQYGERWARHWLDLAGYAESQGIQDADILRPEAYRYRDYVIRAFNADKSYDRFLLEQIAGDELADYEAAAAIDEELSDNLIATGFLRMCADGTHANITNFVPDRLEVIAQEIEILTSATMGLTMKCARCHSHKFDPIPHQDYYRLLAVFKGAMDEHDWMNPDTARFLPQVTTAERTAWQTHQDAVQSKIDAATAALTKIRMERTAKLFEERLSMLPAELQPALRAIAPLAADKLDAAQKELAAKHEKELKELQIDEAELKKADDEYRKQADETAAKLQSLEAEKRPEPRIRALWDRGEPSPTYILRRGNYLTPGRRVEPGFPTVLSDTSNPFQPVALNHKSPKTGRRLAFAQWLVRPDHPLTARVMVNRLWERHFGTGLVATTDNFGKTGSAPSHPELLDWLATEFVRQGWSVKAMHRLILSSRAWRQSSQVLPIHESLDPDNRLLSRKPLQRLDAESLRDSLVALAGSLNQAAYGPSDPVDVRGDGLVTARGGTGGWRRTIYSLQRRTTIPTLLENFDLPAMAPNCISRRQSTVAPQALFLLNDGFVNDLAGRFAARVRVEAGDDSARQIETAWRIAAGRSPDDDERQASTELLEQLTQLRSNESRGKERALTNLCRALMNSAAFLYVD